jgi:DNA repair exonuclease SbcCD ATPase subunit
MVVASHNSLCSWKQESATAEARSSTQQLAAARERLDKATAEAEALRALLATAKEERGQEVGALNGKITALEFALKRAEESVNRLQHETTSRSLQFDAASELEAVQQQLRTANSRESSLQQELAASRADNSRLASDLEIVRAKLGSSEKDLQGVKERLAALQSQASVVTQQRDALAAELQAARDEARRLLADRDTAARDAGSAAAALRAEMDGMRARNESALAASSKKLVRCCLQAIHSFLFLFFFLRPSCERVGSTVCQCFSFQNKPLTKPGGDAGQPGRRARAGRKQQAALGCPGGGAGSSQGLCKRVCVCVCVCVVALYCVT